MTNDKVEKQAAAKITGTSKDVYVTSRGGRMIGMLSHADVSKAVQAALDDAMNKVSLMLLRKVPIVAKLSKVFFDGDDCILVSSFSGKGIKCHPDVKQ